MKRIHFEIALSGVVVSVLFVVTSGLLSAYTEMANDKASSKEAEKIRTACLPAPGQTSRMKWQDGKLLCEIAQVGYGEYKPVKMVYIAEIDKN